jgi:ribonuclease P protein component
MGKLTLRKAERLSRKKWIQELFDRGSSSNLYPYRILYKAHPEPSATGNQVMFSVSKRLFPRAVDRNTIKRRMREAYRHNKGPADLSGKLLIAYIYTAREILPSTVLREKLAKSWGTISVSKISRDETQNP